MRASIRQQIELSRLSLRDQSLFSCVCSCTNTVRSIDVSRASCQSEGHGTIGGIEQYGGVYSELILWRRHLEHSVRYAVTLQVDTGSCQRMKYFLVGRVWSWDPQPVLWTALNEDPKGTLTIRRSMFEMWSINLLHLGSSTDWVCRRKAGSEFVNLFEHLDQFKHFVASILLKRSLEHWVMMDYSCS